MAQKIRKYGLKVQLKISKIKILIIAFLNDKMELSMMAISLMCVYANLN